MKTSFPRLTRIAGLLLALSPLVATVDAATVVNGPYYSSPSWDQTLPAASRFLVLSNFANQAVLDRETGLIWQQAPPAGLTTYQVAYEQCTLNPIGGRLGWRLPNLSELTSLFDPTITSGPALPPGHPFTLPPPAYGSYTTWWSTTFGGLLRPSPPPYARYFFGYGTIFSINPGGTSSYTILNGGSAVETLQANLGWCVRGPGDPGQNY